VKNEEDGIERIILPVHGKGLWSTLYGFMALDADGNTIRRLAFYEHGETPGLGGEVDNPRWIALWDGKKVYDEDFDPEIQVIKGQVTPNTANADYKVDGLSGATITARGVSNLVRYWMGDHGYKSYLKRLQPQTMVGGL
jgi:Na+-transporting NADH:ubiquinone oxidoreductase subunit C